jgi:glycosyltransferase involved in cell wall biosynthesis
MTKVVIVANSTHGGGAENAMMSLLEILSTHGVITTFIALNDMDDGLNFSNRRVVYVGRKWSEGFLKTLKYLGTFRKILKTQNPDVIIVNCELPELFMAFSQVGNSRLIVVEHTSKPWEGRRILGYLVRFILHLKQSYWVTVNSSQLKVWPYRNSATYIPNAIIPTVKDDRVLLDGGVVFVGRLRKEKCPELVIQACQEALVSLKLFGEGNQSSDLKARYASTTDLEFMGYLENPWRYVSSNSLVVVPSEYEGDGLVVLEAIQNGNAILLRDNKDFRRFKLNDEHYFKDLAALIERLITFKKNPTSFKVSKSEQDILLQQRSPLNVGKKWLTLFDTSFESKR